MLGGKKRVSEDDEIVEMDAAEMDTAWMDAVEALSLPTAIDWRKLGAIGAVKR